MAAYLGACSCGATRVTLTSPRAPGDFEPRSDAEHCAFCREHGGIWISDPAGTLAIEPGNATTTRRFASDQVEFHFCAACGELAYAVFERVGVARRDLFAAIAPLAKPVVATNFDGEALDRGRARRLAAWTPLA